MIGDVVQSRGKENGVNWLRIYGWQGWDVRTVELLGLFVFVHLVVTNGEVV